ncbi:unnamed protein product [Cutaneotrichosporon oleaginosum]
MRHAAAGLGTANIGLGPVLLDFKDWVKAGQSSRDAASTVVASGSGNRRESHVHSDPQPHRHHQHHRHNHDAHEPTQPQPRNSYGSAFSSSNRSAEADYSGTSVRESYSSYGGGSSEYTPSSPHAPYRSSPIPRSIPTHSLPSSNSRASISSLSIDSSHSPKILGRAASRLSDRPLQSADTPLRTTAGTTPRNTSYEFQREMSRLSLQSSGHASRSSHHPNHHQSPLGSPALLSEAESPLAADRAHRQSVPAQSPLERRFSRRLMSRHDSQSSNLVASERDEEEPIEEISPARESLDERIREAEERLSRRSSLRESPQRPVSTPYRNRFNTTSAGLRDTVSPPLSNGHGTPQDQAGGSALQNGSSTRSARMRPSIPAEFQQNGRLVGSHGRAVADQQHQYTPSPADSRFSGLVDIGSPRSPLFHQQEEREEIVSPRRATMAAYNRPQTSLEHRDGPNPFNPHRSRMSTSRTFSRDLDAQPLTPGGRRDLPTRARPESVLETSADHQRYHTHGHGLGASRRLSQYGDGGERSQRLSALLSSDRDYNTRHSRDLGAQFGQRRDSLYSRDSVHSPRDSLYSQRDSPRDSLSLSKRHSVSQRDSLSGQRDSYYSQRGSRDLTRESLRLGDFGPRPHTRQESREVRSMGNRQSMDFPRESRDGSHRAPLAPSDSVSAVGSHGESSAPRVESRASVETPRRDPLEIIRRLEETRSKSNRQWEEDRSASAMGKYGEREMLARVPSRLDDAPQSARPGSRMSASRLGPRPASSMSSVRDSNHSGPTAPRTAPNLRRRLDSGNSSNLDSPLAGRTSRASGSMTGPSSEPRVVRRSMTSQGGRISAGGRSGASSDQASTDHGRNLVDAARVLEQRGEIPAEVITKLSAAAALAERANGGVRAANQMATELALEIELDEPDHIESVRKRFPRLAVTLKEASRASDQAVRDLTQALLAARGSSSASNTPARPGSKMERPRAQAEATHRRAMTLDSPGPAAQTRHSPSMSHSAIMSSPLMQSSKPYQPSDRSEPWTPQTSLSRLDPPLSSTSSRFETHHLDPIEQSPPRPAREHGSQHSSPAVGLGISTPSAAWEDRPPTPERPAPPVLRKQASTLSTHTVRGNSFLPSHPPEPTTALSNLPAYSTLVPQLPEHPEADGADEPTQDKQERPSLRLKELPQRESVSSITSVYSNPEDVNWGSGSDIARMGTFGAAQGAQIRASVSERFRKHLNGE